MNIVTIDLPEFTVYSGGEVKPDMDSLFRVAHQTDAVQICCRLNSSDAILNLLLVTDAIREVNRSVKIGVIAPYVPYARQDQRFSLGEPLSLRVFADLLNAQNYEFVAILDPHSAVAPALIRNCIVYTNESLLLRSLNEIGTRDVWFLSPDAGAEKKLQKVARFVSTAPGIATATKHRKPSGEIDDSLTTISVDDFQGKPVLIIDDIYDGGRTFHGLAREVEKRNAGPIYLVVTHSIFSHGYESLESSPIRNVFTTDSVKSHAHPKIVQFNYKEMM